MRIWSIHPRYLDPQGLVALWRETLLAQAVLRGATRGYTHHPQLQRFRAHPAPNAAMTAYLLGVHAEATVRGYNFDRSKILEADTAAQVVPMPVADGQRDYEWQHLLAKLAARNPALHARWGGLVEPALHPLFTSVPGPVAEWEKT